MRGLRHVPRKYGTAFSILALWRLGNNTAFPGSKPLSLNAIRKSKGLGNTVLVVEATGMDVQWLEPRDVTFDGTGLVVGDRGCAGISSHHPQGPYACMSDGSVRSLNGIAPSVLKSLVEVVGP